MFRNGLAHKRGLKKLNGIVSNQPGQMPMGGEEVYVCRWRDGDSRHRQRVLHGVPV